MAFKFNLSDKAILQDGNRFPDPVLVTVVENRQTADGNVCKVQWQRGRQIAETTAPESALRPLG